MSSVNIIHFGLLTIITFCTILKFTQIKGADMDKHKLQDIIDAKRNSLKSDRLDMSFGEIISMYDREEIIIDPIYQRLFRWTIEQQSRFIESIILGIPIPPIFVAEDSEGKWEVVDGLQRISTVLSFFGKLKNLPEKNNWQLTEGELVKQLAGFSLADLSSKVQLNIKRYVCRVEILNWNGDIDVRYELFNRLNTGGTQLSDQEIRNCIFRGVSSKLNDYLEEMAGNRDFVETVSVSDKLRSELYLQELVLRFTCLYEKWNVVDTNLGMFLTEFMRDSLEKDDLDLDSHKVLFLRTLSLVVPLGKDVFRFKNSAFSTSMYDAVMLGISNNIDYYESNSEEIQAKVDVLREHEDFRKNTGSAASSKYRVKKRIEVALGLFSNE